eukprot:Gb_40996 [translate_table: standard]
MIFFSNSSLSPEILELQVVSEHHVRDRFVDSGLKNRGEGFKPWLRSVAGRNDGCSRAILYSLTEPHGDKKREDASRKESHRGRNHRCVCRPSENTMALFMEKDLSPSCGGRGVVGVSGSSAGREILRSREEAPDGNAAGVASTKKKKLLTQGFMAEPKYHYGAETR